MHVSAPPPPPPAPPPGGPAAPPSFAPPLTIWPGGRARARPLRFCSLLPSWDLNFISFITPANLDIGIMIRKNTSTTKSPSNLLSSIRSSVGVYA